MALASFSASISVEAVTPEPQLVTIGCARSIPALSNNVLRSLTGFIRPSATRSLEGMLRAPGEAARRTRIGDLLARSHCRQQHGKRTQQHRAEARRERRGRGRGLATF